MLLERIPFHLSTTVLRNHCKTLQLKATIILFCVSSFRWFYSHLAFSQEFQKMVIAAAVTGVECLRQGAPTCHLSSLGISAFRTYLLDHFSRQGVLDFYHGNSRFLKGSRRCQTLSMPGLGSPRTSFHVLLVKAVSGLAKIQW